MRSIPGPAPNLPRSTSHTLRGKIGDKLKSCTSTEASRYADVTHEVKKVTAGHRLVLTYNLIDTEEKSTLQLAANSETSDAKLERILNRWKDQGSFLDTRTMNDIDYITYCLEHQYTEESLCLSNLKGHDKQIVAQAARIGPQAEYSICLATLERKHAGAVDEDEDDDDEHEIFDEFENDWKLPRVVDLEGNMIVEDFPIEEEAVIPENPFGRNDIWNEEFEGYTGNEGATTTLWYRKTVCAHSCPSMTPYIAC